VKTILISKPTIIFLHLFSGHRRAGDLQMQLEWCSTGLDAQIIVLSLDLAIDPINGNLARVDTIALWRSRIREGVVRGLLGGPPCETWSVARWSKGGPRPLRRLDDCWGIPGLSQRHSEQVDVGNFLLQATLLLVAELVASGGSAVVEHPAIPVREPRCPCIWNLKCMQILMKAPISESFEFDQCEHGQIATAPTRLLAVRLPALKSLLYDTPGRGRCSHAGGHTPLVGKDPTGTWRTAAKKTYPASMCRAIAQAFIAQFRNSLTGLAAAQFRRDGDMPVPEDLQHFCVAFDCYGEQAERAPDYDPQAATVCTGWA